VNEPIEIVINPVRIFKIWIEVQSSIFCALLQPTCYSRIPLI